MWKLSVTSETSPWFLISLFVDHKPKLIWCSTHRGDETLFLCDETLYLCIIWAHLFRILAERKPLPLLKVEDFVSITTGSANWWICVISIHIAPVRDNSFEEQWLFVGRNRYGGETTIAWIHHSVIMWMYLTVISGRSYNSTNVGPKTLRGIRLWLIHAERGSICWSSNRTLHVDIRLHAWWWFVITDLFARDRLKFGASATSHQFAELGVVSHEKLIVIGVAVRTSNENSIKSPPVNLPGKRGPFCHDEVLWHNLLFERLSIKYFPSFAVW